MYNLLIADDNLMYVKSLANNILSKDKSVRLVKIATDGKEAYQYLKSEKVDFLLLDLEMPIYSGIEVLEKIYEEKLNYYPKVIIISGEFRELSYDLLSRYKIIRCLNKNLGIDKIINEITNILKQFEGKKEFEQIDNMIRQELMNLKFNIKHKGTIYIKESIELILNKYNDFTIENLERDVYFYVAKKHKKSIENIKNNIVKATNNMYTECKIDYLVKYFSFEEDTKPTPKIVIYTIVNKIIKSVCIK